MAKLYYSDKTLDIENGSNADKLLIKFDSRESFISFLSDLNVDDFRTYTITNGSEESITGHAMAFSGIVIKFVGNDQVSARINIIQLSENQILKDTIETLASSAMSATEDWSSGKNYESGEIVTYKNSIYKVVQSHLSQEDWTPNITPALFVKIYNGASEQENAEVIMPDILEWIQPTGAHDAYKLGDKVSYEGKIWQSTVDDNVWQPNVYGWVEVTADA